jgi:hypothetical protein
MRASLGSVAETPVGTPQEDHPANSGLPTALPSPEPFNPPHATAGWRRTWDQECGIE